MFFVDEIFDIYNQQFLPVPGGGGKRAVFLPPICPHSAGVIAGLYFVKSCCPPPIPVGGGAVVTNDWCITHAGIFTF